MFNRMHTPLRMAFLSLAAVGTWHFPMAAAQEQPTPQTADLALPATDDGVPGAGPIRRYDWFKSHWQKRRGAWAQQVERDQGAVVFLGDSITEGWGDDFKGSFDDLKLANRGISGDTTRGMLLRMEQDVLSLKPQGVVLLMGTNDLEEGAEPQTIADNVRLIVDQLQAHNPKMPIILCQVLPSSASKSRSAEQIKQVNQLTAAAVKGDLQITVLDTWTLFANAEGDASPEEFPDLLHLNDRGYQVWASALRPILATEGFLETEADEFEIEAGFESLFNSHDLTGWGFRPTTEEDKAAAANWQRNDKQAPPWPIVEEPIDLAGQVESPDRRYRAINGRLVVATPEEGRRIQQLWTVHEFPTDFTLKLEFRATPNADSGVFLRGPQLQCRDYRLAGPYRELKRYRPQDWNELVVVVRDNVAHCTCNGEVIEAEFKLPATGPIGLEGDRGQMEYRRIRIQAPQPAK